MQPNASYSSYFHAEVYGVSTDPIPGDVFALPAECPL